MNFVQLLTLVILLAVAVIGLVQGGRVLIRREADLAPGLPVSGRWAGLLGLIYLGGGLVAGAVALLWLLGGRSGL
jgi:hypothetical protein